MNGDVAERFWSKVAVRGPNDCWEWQRAFVPAGYGSFSHSGRQQGSHRIAWELTHGAIPDGLCVCHHCDNRKCCNPSHLFLGTKADNRADCVKKGRHAVGDNSGARLHPEAVQRGEKQGLAKLKDWQIPYIRSLAEAGVTLKDIARAYGVSRPTIGYILQGRTWRHI